MLFCCAVCEADELVWDGVDELDCVLDGEVVDDELALVEATVGVGVADVDAIVLDDESAWLAEDVLDEDPFPVPLPLPPDVPVATASTAPTLP